MVHFRFVEVKNQELLDKVYRFRYKTWCVETKVLDADDYPDQCESDKYDAYADHFAVLDEEANVAATVRLIHHSPIGYPTENYLDFDKSKYRFEREGLGELSRIFIDPKYRNMKDTKVIIQGLIKELIYFKIRDHGIVDCYGALESGFNKLLNIFKVPYITIGEAKMYYGGLRHPSIMHTRDLELKNPGLKEEYRADHATK